jgi:hypothetical protein
MGYFITVFAQDIFRIQTDLIAVCPVHTQDPIVPVDHDEALVYAVKEVPHHLLFLSQFNSLSSLLSMSCTVPIYCDRAAILVPSLLQMPSITPFPRNH